MKRWLSFITVCTLMITFILSLFSGCSINVNSADKMIVSEWLYLINQKFGFSEYTETEPYIANITPENASFDDVQTAFEYSVLPEGYTALDLDEELTREFCALTLAGAIYIPNTKELNIADYDKLMFPESVTTIVNEGIMELDDNRNFNPNKNIEYDFAVEALERAYYSWANHKFENKANFKCVDNLIDFSGISTLSVTDSGNMVRDNKYIKEQEEWLEVNNFSYDETSGSINLNNISDKGIISGSIISLPASLEYPTGMYLKVDSIIDNEDGSSTLLTSDADIDELFENGFEFQESTLFDAQKAIIYDGAGNLISAGKFTNNNEYIASPMRNEKSGSAKLKYNNSFSLGKGINATVKAEGDSVSVDISLSDSSSSHNKIKTSSSQSLTYTKVFSGISYDYDLTINPFDNISYQKAVLTYDVTDKITYKGKVSGNGSKEWDLANTAVKDAVNKISNTSSEPLTGSKEVANITVIGNGAVSIKLVIEIHFSVDGQIEVTMGYDNAQLGIEVRNWKPVIISNQGQKRTPTINGTLNAELTATLNIGAYLGKHNIIDVEGEIGAGLDMAAVMNEVTPEHQVITHSEAGPAAYSVMKNLNASSEDNEKSELLLCVDLHIYPIAAVSAITSNCEVYKKGHKLFGINTLSKRFLNKDSTPIYKGHLEIDKAGMKIIECTIKELVKDGVEYGDHIEFNPSEDLVMDVGDEAKFVITMLPKTEKKYYTLEDIIVESSDNAVALTRTSFKTNYISSGIHESSSGKINSGGGRSFGDNEDDANVSNFYIISVAAGDAVVTVRTRDNLFHNEINVHVNTPEESSNPAINLITYSASVALNDSITLSMSYIPGGKDETAVFWECDDTSVAVINPITGEIFGVSEGYCTVKAYIPGYEDSGVYCLITVTENYTSTNISDNYYGDTRAWTKIDGQPVIVLTKA